jgi:hypothetical protein
MGHEEKTLTRRDFIRNAAAAAVGTSVIGLAQGCGTTSKTKASEAGSLRSSRVILVRDESVLNPENQVNMEALKTMLGETVTRLTGEKKAVNAWKSLFKPEDTVGLVHSNALNKTHPELIEAVKTALAEAGIPQDKIVMAQARTPDMVKTCTALVCMPGLKAHWLTGIGTVIKNYIMFSGKPRDYHDENSAKLGEIWNLPFVAGKTKLCLVDALQPLCDKGPQVDPQYKWPYKGLIAGTDPVAVETVCLKIITEKRNLIKGEPWPLSPPPVCVEAADKTYGLGTSVWNEIVIDKRGWMQDALV